MGNGIMVPGGELPGGGLTSRGTCGANGGLPTARYPVYSTSRSGVFDASGVYEDNITAERDLLLTDFSAEIESTSQDVARIDVSYCNTKLLVNSAPRTWGKCCAARPQLNQGVGENKTLRVRMTGGVAGDTASYTVFGYQGQGCNECGCGNRLSSNAYPHFSTTLDSSIAVGALAPADPNDLVFEAERDILFTDLAIRVADSVTGVAVPATVKVEYCDTTYVDTVETGQYGYCCDQRPQFLVGVREGKRMRITIESVAAVAVNPAAIQVSLSGMQGAGCCG